MVRALLKREMEMLECCRLHAETFLERMAPLQGYDIPLRTRIGSILKKWGKVVAAYDELVVLRCSTSHSIGINAETHALTCPTCTNGVAPIVIIGSRLLYFVWRLSMVAATFFTSNTRFDSDRSILEGNDSWPGEAHLKQVRIAYEIYFTDKWLETEGLDELNTLIFDTSTAAALLHGSVVDAAELFVLMHEIQHQIPLFVTSNGTLGMNTQFTHPVKISDVRARRWSDELTNDANAAWLLWLSLSDKFVELGMRIEQARIQAGSIVFAGVDTALRTLQLLEEEKYGNVPLQSAAYAKPFVWHPPSGYRRDVFSNVAFTILTGRPSSELYSTSKKPDAWMEVATNIVSHMKVMDRLISAYRERYPKPITKEG